MADYEALRKEVLAAIRADTKNAGQAQRSTEVRVIEVALTVGFAALTDLGRIASALERQNELYRLANGLPFDPAAHNMPPKV